MATLFGLNDTYESQSETASSSRCQETYSEGPRAHDVLQACRQQNFFHDKNIFYKITSLCLLNPHRRANEILSKKVKSRLRWKTFISTRHLDLDNFYNKLMLLVSRFLRRRKMRNIIFYFSERRARKVTTWFLPEF